MRQKIFVIFLAAIALWLVFSLAGGGTGSSRLFDAMRARLHLVEGFHHDYPVGSVVLLALGVLFAACLGFPPPGLVSVGAGAVLGFTTAFAVSLPAAGLGALGPFMLSRVLVGPYLERRFPARTAAMRAGLAKDGPFYLFSLRLVPLVPFPLVNLFMGVTGISAGVFVLVSMLGRVPLTVLYCNAGVQLASVESAADILTPKVALSLAGLAVFPHLARWTSRRLRRPVVG